MASDIASPLESTIEKHIDSTSRLVRQVDLAFSLSITLSLILGGLFLAIIADHWLLKEGLSMPLRLGIFIALFALIIFYVYRKIVPLVLYPINPVYTAHLIEQEAPSFKNSLINWLLLRRERLERNDLPNDKIDERMFDGLVRTAAVNVQTVSADHVIDFSKLIWSGTSLVILLAMFIGYAALSPKSPFASLVRVIAPFSRIERPQSAKFKVKPGDTKVLQGETLIISAEVISQSDEPVYLAFSTDDGQAVKQRIPMTLPDGKFAYETSFPPGNQGSERGFNSSVDYWIVQGESRSKQYRIDVLPVASVDIVSLQYDFPGYTGLSPEIIEHGGDVRSLEETTVTVAVRSTLPLEKIDLVFDDNPANVAGMKITNDQKTEAKGTFTLKNPSPYKSFAFQAIDKNGNVSHRRSGIYWIDVIPDQSPKIQWADTALHLKDQQMDLPVNKTLSLPIQAEDPDYALRYLYFKIESTNNKQYRIPDVSLLESPATGPTKHRGQITKTILFLPAEQRLNVGDTVEVWVEAKDTKYPEANTGKTPKITINITDIKEEKEKEDQQHDKAQDKGEGNQPQQGEDQEQTQDKNAPQQNESNENKEGESDEQNKQQEQNLNEEKQSDQNSPEQNKQDKNQNGASGQGDQQKDQPEDSNKGNAGNDHSDQQGDQNSEGQNNGQKGNDSSNLSDENQQGEDKRSKQAGGEQESSSEVNPETQPGDAMEKIIEQMKKEDKFDNGNDKTNRQQNQDREKRNGKYETADPSQRERTDSLDPNSPNRRNEGNDPSNSKQSDQPLDGNPQNQQDKQNPDKPNDGNHELEKPGDSESQEGSLQDDKGSPDTQGTPEKSGDPQPGQEGGNSPAEQQPPNNPQSNVSENQRSPQTGGTGGGGGFETKTATEDPNLEYAQKVTNLVLEYLEDQLKDKPSDELLKNLGWTEEQLRQFYTQWQKMAEDSRKPQQREDGKDVWMEALKSLGLKPNKERSVLQESQTTVKDKKRVREAQRFEPPEVIRDRAKIYNEGIGK